MSSRRRKKKKTIYGFVEGAQVEQNFVNHLIKEYAPDKKERKITINCTTGGCPNSIIAKAIRESFNFNTVFVLLDEDFESVSPVSNEVKEGLAKCWSIEVSNLASVKLLDMQSKNVGGRNPILIVSTPICADGFILDVLGEEGLPVFDPNERGKQISKMKNKLKEKVRCSGLGEEFYADSLKLEVLQERRDEVLALDNLLKALFE